MDDKVVKLYVFNSIYSFEHYWKKQPSCQYVRHGIQQYYEIQLKEHMDKKYKLTVTPLRWRDVLCGNTTRAT